MKRFTSKMIPGLTPAYMAKVAKGLAEYDKTGKLDPKHFTVTKVVVPAKPQDVREVRKALGLDRAGLAQVLGVSAETIRSYEQGRRTPDGPVTKLLRLLAKTPRMAPVLQAM